jgi:O-antigen biosynthesis protein
MFEKKAKIVMMAMFKNESRVMRRMLESCYKYIDYYVIQNNGSTDGTDQIVKEFFAEKNIPGVLYDVEEGWVGFGWNRDHLIQKVQSINHGCDWILKMDCDEILEVDEDFDWGLLDDKSIQAFHVASGGGPSVYYRAWMWNANLPWRFNHDPCHETIRLDIEGIQENFSRFNLPTSFRQVGFNEGQSWSVPTKFVSDALVLEEKMIREQTMLTNLYHFFYIGKSYFDAIPCSTFPLGETHANEYARRAIFYLTEYINYTHEFNITGQPKGTDEMAYNGMLMIADCYVHLKQNDNAYTSWEIAGLFAPGRNDHLFYPALLAQKNEDWPRMLKLTTVMMQPERTNAFPEYISFIDQSMYNDHESMRVQQLHNIALENVAPKTELAPLPTALSSTGNLKFSLITPEHKRENIPYLLQLFTSIITQSYDNWEWVILLNGDGVNESDIPEEIKSHGKVKIFNSKINNGSIGAIKQEAFFLGTGDILVEMDHDDMLIKNCLEKLNETFTTIDAGFVYSDNVVLHESDDFIPYDESQGWKYKTFNVNGKNLIAMDSFEPSSQSLAYIWYAPDHVRAWRRDVYLNIGGHSPDLDVCDDHELMIRTYLNTKFHRIPEPLYVYRITGNNSWLERNDRIQQLTVELFYENARKLAERDAELKGLMKIDIGGGISPLNGYTTIDIADADIISDLNEGIPLPDNSVGVINASHVLEHLKDPYKSMKEIHRVLCHGGWAFIEVPSTDGRGAFQDPTHVSFWNENSFTYYTEAGRAAYIRNKDVRFQSYRVETLFHNEDMKHQNIPVTIAWLVAIKNDDVRFPGKLYI